ncbi:TonB-dependent siderophore receptor [Rouxiella sp. S1S-2]|uniref:TonB-dependent siderophore receptor n=1 Tax=Rouxiella sp. S1S-2 TaxID=2653856 RepID=UPI001265839D|nr:TonB-dependent siderophore receptor [Rouxiella sp. S1S-2]KAB7897465.1 TonB-dependent siderophore receptor [Rouxiella sp. S1S-2]
MNTSIDHKKTALAILLMGFISSTSAANINEDKDREKEGEDILVIRETAEQELKQQAGASIITAEDIKRTPPVNDLSDIIRKMPGVNLTGNSASGSRGNNRQIDIRGMGPENTLILIDGNPVRSRDSVRYSWRGERDTRGDTNWVPPEMVERIEVLRGPAAAHYGSGAAGGVVNIITKRPTNDWTGSLSLFTNQPESDKEGATKRANFSLSGPLSDDDSLTMRLYGNINKTDSDSWNINTVENGSQAAGREGVRNRDINSVFSWKMTPNQIIDFEAGYSRQGNIYAGDTQYSTSSATTSNLAQSGAETNRLYRQNYGITHNGIWDWGQSKLNFSYEKTNNTRLDEGMAGSGEGRITDAQNYSTSRLQNYRANGEVYIPFDFYADNMLTLGTEWTREELEDPASTSFTTSSDTSVGGVSTKGSERKSKNSASLGALYFEDNMDFAGGATKLIPGLRFDHHTQFGNNFSPSLNIQQDLGDKFKLKAGIARVFKAPNLYQSNPSYMMQTRGNGCPLSVPTGSCYLLGNQDLDAEVSVNKEVGIQFSDSGVNAGLTYFRNDYKNKIISGENVIGKTASGANVLQWQNGGKALIDGLEANLKVPVVEDLLTWNTNATYMFRSKQKSTGNPLSIIPKYTLNTSLDWQVTDKLALNTNMTTYGRQKPRGTPESRTEAGGLSKTVVGGYSIVGIGANYTINKNLRISGGINNLFDRSIYRADDGASTYNEPGRAYYAGVTTSF